MKRTFLLFASLLLSLAPAMAQLTEVEPNDSYTTANALPMNTTISGVTCNITPGGEDWFRIVLPVDGILKLKCSVSSNIPNPPPGISFRLFSKTNLPFNNFTPPLPANGTAVDSFTWAALAADTFYIQASNGVASATNVCYNYSFSCSVIPATFLNDAEPDNYPLHPLPLAYNTPVEGHLGFHNQPGQGGGYDGDDYYTIVPPSDGVLRIISESESQSGSPVQMSFRLFSKMDVPLNSQDVTVGGFQQPHTDTLYWPCILKDTFRLKVDYGNFFAGGYAYRIKYDIIQPVFAADVEPNNSYATAHVVNPNTTIEGHQYFYSATDFDYYKFYKPDTGYLKIYLKAETWGAVTNQEYQVTIETKNQGFIAERNALIGGNAQPSLDSIIVASLPADSFYVIVKNRAYNSPCISYQLKIRSSGITGVGVAEVANTGFSVYPNPSKGSFSISCSTVIPAALVRVYNIYGQTVFSQSMALPSAREIQLPGVTPGIYYVEVGDGVQRRLQKLLVQ